MRYPLPPPVLTALERLEAAGYAAYAVGGCVRDDVLGIRPKEYDLCSAAKPDQVRTLFSDARVIDTGIKHGTVTVVLQGMPLEVTTFRSDGTYTDARHPDTVLYSGSIEEDLKRRDFTCNAMAFSPLRGFVDPHDGRGACLQKIIQAVGNPSQRFREDALRILRALRFAAVLGFQIDPGTQIGMRELTENIHLLSRERVAAEFDKLLTGDGAADILRQFPDIVRTAIPPLADLMKASPQPTPWERGLLILQNTPAELTLRWAALLLGLGADTARDTLRQLRQPTRLIIEVRTLIASMTLPVQEPLLPRRLAEMGYPGLHRLLQLKLAAAAAGEEANPADYNQLIRRARQVADTHPCLSLKDLPVTGNDLLGMGYPRGQVLGETLNWLFDQVLDGTAPAERETLLTLARQRLDAGV